MLALGLVVVLAICFMSAVRAQQTPQAPPQTAAAPPQAPSTPPPPRPAVNQSDDPLLKTFRWRNIGPASMGGRIDDFAVVEGNPSTYYVGFATGGVFKTVNNGTTFTPIFDTYPASSIGDIAVAPSDPNIVLRRAPASRTTARARRSATASTSRPTPARRSSTSASRTRSRSPASSSTRPSPTSSTWRRSATCSGRTRSAGSTRRSTAGRPGRTRSSSTRTPASPTW